MNAVDHNNVVIFDDRGIPSIMCRFVRPKDTEEVPAVFKIGDKVADAIYISKYPNIVIDGRAYSMPMADPTVNITFDGAVQACRCKGLGWHLMTAVEYEYLLNQSREKGTMPHGNTDWGKDYYHNDEQGKVSNLGRTYTGTGPVTELKGDEIQPVDIITFGSPCQGKNGGIRCNSICDNLCSSCCGTGITGNYK